MVFKTAGNVESRVEGFRAAESLQLPAREEKSRSLPRIRPSSTGFKNFRRRIASLGAWLFFYRFFIISLPISVQARNFIVSYLPSAMHKGFLQSQLIMALENARDRSFSSGHDHSSYDRKSDWHALSILRFVRIPLAYSVCYWEPGPLKSLPIP